ncbi:MAG: hypothetical protein J6J59_08625 [Peptococcaceae bacterium]|nr:hypothetical protein [Peptococcaceae bacterium]
MGNKISKKEKQRREAEAQAKAKKKETWSFMLMCLVMVGVMWFVGYFFNGSELQNQPAKKQIVSVEITNTKFTDEVKVFTTEDEIKLAHSALDLVRVKHKEVEGNTEPYLTLVYNMEDGTERVLQIAEGAATWDGVTKPLVREKMMIEMMDAVFFPEFVAAEEEK